MRPQKIFSSILFVAFFLFLFQLVAFGVRQGESMIFSCNSGGPLGIALISGVWIALSIGALFFFGMRWWQGNEYSYPLLCIIAAGGSNLLERLVYGCVGDYLKVPFFPIFNMADVVLSLSVVFLLWREIRIKG